MDLSLGSLLLGLTLLGSSCVEAEEAPMAVPAGALDASFEPGTGPAFGTLGGTRLGSILTMVPLPDGRLMVGGFWDRFDGQENASLARLTTGGAVDSSFVPQLTNFFATLSNLHVRAMVRQPDGKLVVSWLGGIDRLEPDGEVDPSFQRQAFVFAAELALQPDGKILVAGPGLMRLFPEGAIDTDFARGQERFEGEAKGILVQTDGKIVFVGDLKYEEDGVTQHVSTGGLGRLNPDGSPDHAFAPPVSLPDASSIYATALQQDDKILLGGAFIRLGAVSEVFGVARLHKNGAVDATFQSGRGVRTLVQAEDLEYSIDGAVFGLECLPDGKIVVGGAFLTFDNVARTNLARLHEDGSVDSSFGTGPWPPGGVVDHIKPTLDGNYFISGVFTNIGTTLRPRLARVTGVAVIPPPPPMVRDEPTNQSVVLGDTITFSLSATSYTSVAWMFNGRLLPKLQTSGRFSPASVVQPPNILGADTTQLRIVDATAANQGAYRCVVTGAGGSVTSAVAQLTVLAALNFSVSGSGTVSPSLGVTTFELGQSLTFTAAPAAGWLFSGWRAGDAVILTPKITVVMASNVTLVATFVRDLFALAKGSFNGLVFEPVAPRHERAGFLTLKLASSGAYSATLHWGGRKLALNGVFTRSGESVVEPRARPGSGAVTLRLQLMTEGTRITGTLSDASGEVPLEMRRAAFGKSLPASPWAGLYTLLVQPSAGATLNIGDGFGNVSVDANGNVALAVSLADGAGLVQRVGLAEQGDWPLFASLQGGRGSIFGWVKFGSNASNALSAEMPLHWTRSAQPKPLYTGGFTNDFVLLGSAYSSSTAGPLLNLTNALTILSGADLAAGVTNEVRLEVNNKVTNLSSNSLKLTLLAAKGQFKGTVAVPDSRKPAVIQGVLLPNQNIGGGFFRGSNVTGQVYFGL